MRRTVGPVGAGDRDDGLVGVARRRRCRGGRRVVPSTGTPWMSAPASGGRRRRSRRPAAEVGAVAHLAGDHHAGVAGAEDEDGLAGLDVPQLARDARARGAGRRGEVTEDEGVRGRRRSGGSPVCRRRRAARPKKPAQLVAHREDDVASFPEADVAPEALEEAERREDGEADEDEEEQRAGAASRPCAGGSRRRSAGRRRRSWTRR